MLGTLLLPRLSFLTLVMASFALKLCCSVFSVRLDIVVVVCKLWLSALSHLCLSKMHKPRQQGKKKKKNPHLT